MIVNIGVDSLYRKYNLNARLNFHALEMSVTNEGSLEESVNLKYNIKACIVNDLLDSLKSKNYIRKVYLST